MPGRGAGKKLSELTEHTDSISSAHFSPDGKLVVTTSYDQKAKIWDAATGKRLADLTGHEKAVYSSSFSPDGQKLVTASADNTAKIWLTPPGIMNWLKTAPIHRLTQKDLKDLGIDFIDLKTMVP